MTHTANHNFINLADVEIERRWEDGNDNGMGESTGNYDDTPTEALQREGYANIRTYYTRNVLRHSAVGSKDGRIVAVRESNGPWGVDITEA